jgi:hypothetical protein
MRAARRPFAFMIRSRSDVQCSTPFSTGMIPMTDTLDQVPGTWRFWLATKENPHTTEYSAVFVASSPGSSDGEVTLTLNGTSFTGTWQEKKQADDERVTFKIEGVEGGGRTSHFHGYLVGLAMGGYIAGLLGPITPHGSWSAYKVSD